MKWPRSPYQLRAATEPSRESRLWWLKSAIGVYEWNESISVPLQLIPRIIGPFIALVPLQPFAVHHWILPDGEEFTSQPLAWITLLDARD